MTLSASIGLRRGTLDLDVAFSVDASVLAVVGPNGAGKTTLLRAVCGLDPIDRGQIVIDGRVVEDPAAGIRLPPEERHVGVVFQEHRLFPNLSVVENVAFGLRASGVPRASARRQAVEWLERVGLASGPTRVDELSGGQAQRVALARALITQPAVLLLDEPLAAADPSARADLRHVIRTSLDQYEGARLLVTHDPIEAAALAQEIMVLEGGRVTQAGPLAEVTAHPRSAWVANMVGLNLVEGSSDGQVVLLPGGQRVVAASPVTGPVFVAFRPNAVVLHRSRPTGSARNVWAGTAAELYPVGDRARVRVEGDLPLIAEVTAAAVAELDLASGGPVWSALKATDVDVYPA